MNNSQPGFNPYTDGSRSRLGTLVTALMVVVATAFIAYYAKIGYDNAREDCTLKAAQSTSAHTTVEFSLTWSPPFTNCVVREGENQSA